MLQQSTSNCEVLFGVSFLQGLVTLQLVYGCISMFSSKTASTMTGLDAVILIWNVTYENILCFTFLSLCRNLLTTHHLSISSYQM